MTVNSHFERLASAAVLSSLEREAIKTSIITLRTRLAAWFGPEIIEHFQFGSSTRGTILPRKMDENSDIDYMVVFSDQNLQPQRYLEKLRRFVLSRYSSSEVFRSHPTVVLSLSHIKFELVPAIKAQWAGYRIPAPTRNHLEWIDTYPNSFNDEITNKNKNHSNLIKPLVRILKYWNARNNYPFESFPLEQDVVKKVTWNTNFGSYVLSGFESLQLNWDSPQWKQTKLSQLREQVARIRSFERMRQSTLAETEACQTLPPL
jgi:hypothetical protein